jgi:sterol desaturase/sphingolipid hydroxylase (fatty acid hydroxylase superfamily)
MSSKKDGVKIYWAILFLGLLAALCAFEIWTWTIGVADRNSPKAWIALAFSITFLGFCVLCVAIDFYYRWLSKFFHRKPKMIRVN